MTTKYIAIAGMISSLMLGNAAYAFDYYQNATVNNQTHHVIKISLNGQWKTDASGAQFNSNPIAVAQEIVTVDSYGFSQSTRYSASYDVWDAHGNYLANCTLSYYGYPGDFNNAIADPFCQGDGSVSVEVYKEASYQRTGNYSGTFHFVIRSSK